MDAYLREAEASPPKTLRKKDHYDDDGSSVIVISYSLAAAATLTDSPILEDCPWPSLPLLLTFISLEGSLPDRRSKFHQPTP